MKLRRYLLLVGISLSAGLLAGCAVLNKPVEFVDKFIGQTFFPPYSGPKVKIAVADFEIKAAKATSGVGLDLKEMLVAGLTKSNHFTVISNVQGDSAKEESAIIIAVEIINFEPRASGGSQGVGGGGSASSGILGSLLGSSVNKSYIALNIRIVDAKSSKVLAAGHIAGQAMDNEGAVKKKVSEDESSAGFSAYVNTPMEQAVNKCILEAVQYIVQNVPENYYKGDKNGKA
jgi:curli biogenesis system outer membrane secretion channel CsgG